ncbi:hypothetical protein KIK06_23460 [Nocardiopsis sp. EMB25]|uniref:hypothetical protein n=1 Tax=Nocardiopsis sp. EMB25 TaxID=2835867 RepID=UPI002284A080|nr:hypothetical protein [Nocardiopsis sp. EMB25]MCY9786845.1 hypothetical protein [Nocardiopsis sp. EMB25]
MSEPRTYTTRPRTVQAMQVTRETLAAVEEWAHVRCELANLPGPGLGLTAGVIIRSRDGKVRAAFGDYLVLPLEVIGKADFEARFAADEDQGDAEEAPATDTRGRPLPTIWGVGTDIEGGTSTEDAPTPEG